VDSNTSSRVPMTIAAIRLRVRSWARGCARHDRRPAAAERRGGSGRIPYPLGGAHERHRHGARNVRIELAFRDEVLELAVTNPLPARGSRRRGGGHGLIGMRERATLLGGSFDAGRDNGVFRLRGRIPPLGHRA
jgi:hypothetical protein